MEQFTVYYGTLPDGRNKIGVDCGYPNRIVAQKITNARVLEVHTCVYEVSDREMELQREYGVKVDTTPYYVIYFKNQSIEQREKISAALMGIKRNHTFEHQSNAAKAAHISKLASGVYKTIGVKKRALTNEDAIEIRKQANEGVHQRTIATNFGVSQRAVANIIHKRTYQDA